MKHLDEDTNVDAGRQLRNPVSGYTCRDRAAREWGRRKETLCPIQAGGEADWRP